jgi:hypothetical protein
MGAELRDGRIWSLTFRACPLHAAAPKLLAALEACVEEFNGIMPTDLVERFGATRLKAREAIREARA